MERTAFIPILNLAVVSAFPEVDDVCLYKYDLLHIYFQDQSFNEIDITGWDNADLFQKIPKKLLMERPLFEPKEHHIRGTITNGSVHYNGKMYAHERLHEHEGESVFLAQCKWFLWVWKWNGMVVTTIPLRDGEIK